MTPFVIHHPAKPTQRRSPETKMPVSSRSRSPRILTLLSWCRQNDIWLDPRLDLREIEATVESCENDSSGESVPEPANYGSASANVDRVEMIDEDAMRGDGAETPSTCGAGLGVFACEKIDAGTTGAWLSFTALESLLTR